MTETYEKSFPFDSENVDGKPDRAYVADDFAEYFREFISSGMFMKQSDNLQVKANGDMSVTLKPGALIINGYRYKNPFDITIQLDPADGLKDRIDRISITWINEERDIHYTVQKGELSYSPEPPDCRRTADYKDYVTADVYISAGAIKITQDNITDQRLDSEICGLAFPFYDIDTTMVFDQLQAFYDKVVAENEDWKAALEAWCIALKDEFTNWLARNTNNWSNQFDNWFDTNTSDWTEKILNWFNIMKGQLSEDAAGNLQNQIYGINALLREITDDEIVAIVNGTYVEDDEGGDEPDIYSRITRQEIDDAIDRAFSIFDEDGGE